VPAPGEEQVAQASSPARVAFREYRVGAREGPVGVEVVAFAKGARKAVWRG
jgi:hypothetical protein